MKIDHYQRVMKRTKKDLVVVGALFGVVSLLLLAHQFGIFLVLGSCIRFIAKLLFYHFLLSKTYRILAGSFLIPQK